MSPFKNIDDPKGAFGYDPDHLGAEGRNPQVVGYFHNVSSTETITAGAAVILSSLSTDGTGVTITTLIASPLFIGVALTSMTTGQSTDASSNAAPASWGRVQIAGPCPGALLTAATTPGDQIGTVNSTVAGSTGGGYLGVINTTAVAVSSFGGLAGIAITSGTTGASGFLTTVGPRGIVYIRPSVYVGSTL